MHHVATPQPYQIQLAEGRSERMAVVAKSASSLEPPKGGTGYSRTIASPRKIKLGLAAQAQPKQGDHTGVSS